MLDQKHDPARGNRSANEYREAECPEPDHHPRLRTLCDTEDDRGEEGKHKNCTEMTKHQDAFLPFASECASTAEMMFSKPATTMNFVP